MHWPKKCDSIEFDRLWKQYDYTAIVDKGIEAINLECSKIYISNLYRSLETAKRLFPDREYYEIDGAEVPLRSYKDSEKLKAVWYWNVRGRLQWLFNNTRQEEIRFDTVKRCIRLIEILESAGEDCAIVSHGFLMKTLVKCLKKRGYNIEGNKFSFDNLQIVSAEL